MFSYVLLPKYCFLPQNSAFWGLISPEIKGLSPSPLNPPEDSFYKFSTEKMVCCLFIVGKFWSISVNTCHYRSESPLHQFDSSNFKDLTLNTGLIWPNYRLRPDSELHMHTVNSDIFARVFYYCETSRMQSFEKIKHSLNGGITRLVLY